MATKRKIHLYLWARSARKVACGQTLSSETRYRSLRFWYSVPEEARCGKCQSVAPTESEIIENFAKYSEGA